MRIAQIAHAARATRFVLYTLIWEGDVPDGFEVLVGARSRRFSNHRAMKIPAMGCRGIWLAARSIV